ncbi:MAG: glycosyltransferase [Aquisalimonadaceae bacterium]
MTISQAGPFSRISVVVPVSSRHDDPESLFHHYRNALSGLHAELEFIYVVDGASARVGEALGDLQSSGEAIRIIKLGRRFGEAAALSVGFRYCTGEAVLTLPAFHQVEAADLPQLIRRLQHADMVVGRRWPRIDSRFNRIQTSLFFRVARLLTRTRFQDFGCNVRAMRRKVCEEVMLYGEQHRFLPVLATHHGFRVVEVDLRQSPQDEFRRLYPPGIHVRRMLDLLTVFFLVKFTRKPMRFFGLLGTFTAGIGALYILYLLFERLFLDMPLADRPALLLSSLLVVLGVQVFAMGLIGELIIYTHARQVQEYAIEEMIGEPFASGDAQDVPLSDADTASLPREPGLTG